MEINFNFNRLFDVIKVILFVIIPNFVVLGLFIFYMYYITTNTNVFKTIYGLVLFVYQCIVILLFVILFVFNKAKYFDYSFIWKLFVFQIIGTLLLLIPSLFFWKFFWYSMAFILGPLSGFVIALMFERTIDITVNDNYIRKHNTIGVSDDYVAILKQPITWFQRYSDSLICENSRYFGGMVETQPRIYDDNYGGKDDQ